MGYDLDSLIEEMDFSRNFLNDCGNNVILTNFEIDVLKKYHSDYLNCSCLNDIIFLVEDILNEDSTLEDLETISKSISERDYYLNTNK